jgi:hypothetical protein
VIFPVFIVLQCKILERTSGNDNGLELPVDLSPSLAQPQTFIRTTIGLEVSHLAAPQSTGGMEHIDPANLHQKQESVQK